MYIKKEIIWLFVCRHKKWLHIATATFDRKVVLDPNWCTSKSVFWILNYNIFSGFKFSHFRWVTAASNSIWIPFHMSYNTFTPILNKVCPRVIFGFWIIGFKLFEILRDYCGIEGTPEHFIFSHESSHVGHMVKVRIYATEGIVNYYRRQFHISHLMKMSIIRRFESVCVCFYLHFMWHGDLSWIHS